MENVSQKCANVDILCIRVIFLHKEHVHVCFEHISSCYNKSRFKETIITVVAVMFQCVSTR
jgi:hypothetical protein